MFKSDRSKAWLVGRVDVLSERDAAHEDARVHGGQVIFALASSVLLSSCALLSPQEWQELLQAEERWAAAGISDYEFETELGCFCSRTYTEARRVRVRDGVIAEVEWLRDWQAEYPELRRTPPEGTTVEGLFAEIRRRAESESVCEMQVRYDAEFGVPLRISTKGPSNVTDTGWGRRVRNFRVLE